MFSHKSGRSNAMWCGESGCDCKNSLSMVPRKSNTVTAGLMQRQQQQQVVTAAAVPETAMIKLSAEFVANVVEAASRSSTAAVAINNTLLAGQSSVSSVGSDSSTLTTLTTSSLDLTVDNEGKIRNQRTTSESLNPTGSESICVLCSKIFPKEALSSHMAEIHERHTDFRCTMCSKAFRQKTSLANHVRTVHEKIKDYTCPICRKGFGQKTTLTNHIKTVHEKRKDLTCEICFRSFGQRTTLNNHMKSIHDKVKEFGCFICLKTFGQKANLQSHMRNIHKEGGKGERGSNGINNPFFI